MAKPPKTIYIKGKIYYRYGCYRSYSNARRTANYFKKTGKSRYFIQTYDQGYFFPQKQYALYLNKVVNFS